MGEHWLHGRYHGLTESQLARMCTHALTRYGNGGDWELRSEEKNLTVVPFPVEIPPAPEVPQPATGALNEWLSAEQAALVLGVSVNSMRRYATMGIVKHYPGHGRARRFLRSEVEGTVLPKRGPKRAAAPRLAAVPVVEPVAAPPEGYVTPGELAEWIVDERYRHLGAVNGEASFAAMPEGAKRAWKLAATSAMLRFFPEKLAV